MINNEVNKPKLDINCENIDLTSIIVKERIESRLKDRINRKAAVPNCV